jgi:hypothetical protein
MPNYLDKLSIDFLFDKAKRLIKISEMRQIIEENKKDFESCINTWKKNIDENTKDSNEEKTDENFFKTGVMDMYNYMNKYPHSKKFMDDYNKKYFSKADTFEIKLKDLEKKYTELLEQCKQKKSLVYKARNQLLNIYHLELFEGLNFRTDGLASLIRAIWNIGVNVDINYMPNYLDKSSIDFLFDKARRLIKISEIRQIIEENKKDFELSIATWKKNTEENNKDPSEEKTDESFFKTGVMGKYNYMNKYPHSKKFMDDYNKKYFSKADTFEIKLNKNKKLFKSRNIPLSIIEKHNKIEKLKWMLNNLLEKNDIIEKKEIERLSREFMTNDYREKYHVSMRS